MKMAVCVFVGIYWELSTRFRFVHTAAIIGNLHQHISDISDVTDFLLFYHFAESCTEVQQTK